jgi:hypothetical protein
MRGGLLEKAKALARITEEDNQQKNPFYRKCYGEKYARNDKCPCCQQKAEKDNHVLWECEDTRQRFRKELRAEVLSAMADQLSVTSRDHIKELPAWFDCEDDRVNGNTETLRAIGNYDKRLGSLGYIPKALMKWLKSKKIKFIDKKFNASTAAMAAQKVICKRNYETWRYRCEMLHKDWREYLTHEKKDAEAAANRDREAQRRRATDAKKRQQQHKAKRDQKQRDRAARERITQRGAQRITSSSAFVTHPDAPTSVAGRVRALIDKINLNRHTTMTVPSEAQERGRFTEENDGFFFIFHSAWINPKKLSIHL